MTIPIGRMAEALPDLKKLPTYPPPTLTGVRADVWAERLAFAEVSANAALATVGVWPVRPGDKATAPEKRGQDELQPLDAFPEGPLRVALEAAHPTGCAGSGFLIDADGTILTSASYFDDKVKTIYIYLPDGSRTEAKLLGKDGFYDIAALKIDISPGTKLKPVEWSVKPLTQGSAVAVLGRSESPGRITLNSGSVSAKGRFEDTCTQISALIDYGNLGGPVIDLDGKSVGMAVRLSDKTPWRQNCGVGFMLNADQIEKFLPDLKAGKKLERPVRPYLGVEADGGANDVKGAKVKTIPVKSPAGAAGVLAGDIIVSFDQKPVENWRALLLALHARKPGDTVSVTVKRGDKEVKCDVKLGVRE
jgi:S1-C subfamily serine protease